MSIIQVHVPRTHTTQGLRQVNSANENVWGDHVTFSVRLELQQKHGGEWQSFTFVPHRLFTKKYDFMTQNFEHTLYKLLFTTVTLSQIHCLFLKGKNKNASKCLLIVQRFSAAFQPNKLPSQSRRGLTFLSVIYF